MALDEVYEASATKRSRATKAEMDDAEVYIEIWCEKDALAGVILPVSREYDVPLMVARGFSSD
jgi:hypothetical protein